MPAPPEYATELALLVERVAESLLALPEDVAARRPAPGKWSAKAIVGHLGDSASNNHGRFVRAQWSDDLGQVAFRPLPPDAPATLDWFMRDYVDHFEHHLRQLVAATGRAIA